MINEKVLFIVEGERAEPKLIETINKTLYFDGKIEIYSYKTSIYHLYKDLSLDDDLDLPLLLREKETNKKLKKILSKEFSAIYLIFDFDPHHEKFDIENLINLQQFFNNSLEKGLLLINYPMLESFKHLKTMPDKEFLTKTITKEEVKSYKKLVGIESNYSDPTSYHNHVVKELIIHHLIKMNHIINKKKELPSANVVGTMVCDYKFIKEQYINYLNDKLFVLSTIFYYLIELMPTSFYNELKLPIMDDLIC